MKKTVAVVIVAALLLGLGKCVIDLGASGSGKRIVSVATVQPLAHPVSVGLRSFRDFIAERMGDEFEVRIYYNGVMGGNSEALELLQMGTLNLVATSGSNLEAFNNIYKIFGLPYLFKDEESFRRCMNDPRFIDAVYDCTAEKGIEGVAWFANGVNNIYAFKPVHTPDDLKGLKIRIQASEANVKMVQAFDAAAVVMAYGEVYTALQNRVIDAGLNPEMALVSMKHGEVAKFSSRTEHQIFTDMLVANTGFLDSLTPEQREVFNEGFALCTRKEVEEWDTQIAQCIADAEAMGVQFIEVDKEPFQELQKPVREGLLASHPQLRPLYDRVQEIQN